MTMRTLTHPNLPGREIHVHEQAVAHHARAGWADSTEGESAGTGEPMVGTEHPADGTLSPAIGRHEVGGAAGRKRTTTDDGDQAGDDSNETEK